MLIDDPDFDYSTREVTCRILDAHNVPFVVWRNDAAAYYRYNEFTIGNFTILVHDFDEATKALTPYGYTEVAEDADADSENEEEDEDEEQAEARRTARYPGDWPKEMPRRKLQQTLTVQSAEAVAKLVDAPPPDTPLTDEELADLGDDPVVLMRDSDFGIDATTHDGIIPTLAEYVDDTIDKYLTLAEPLVAMGCLESLYAAEDQSRTHPDLRNYNEPLPALRDPEFAGKLKPGNRQWHLDALEGKGKVWEEAYQTRVRAERQRALQNGRR